MVVLTAEEFIEEVNNERKEEKKQLENQKNLESLMKWCKEMYDAAIVAGFTEEQSMQYAYGYYHNTLFPTNKQ